MSVAVIVSALSSIEDLEVKVRMRGNEGQHRAKRTSRTAILELSAIVLIVVNDVRG
jgi:hypothetical protein